MDLLACFDESGLNPHEDKALVIGGYLGTTEEWERVTLAWNARLSASPAIRYFKNSEANNLQGEFRHFDAATAEQKKNDLAALLGESELQGFCASVRHDLLAHREPAATKQAAGSRTFDWGFFTATSGVLQYTRDHFPEDTVNFVFDERRELAQCIAMLSELKELAQDYGPWVNVFSRAGTCIAGNDKNNVALQMADLLAGEFCAMGNAGKPPSEAWKLLVSHRAVVHIPCDMPLAIPMLVALQGMAKQIKDASGKILKRIYKDQERSPELQAECDVLIANQVLYENAITALMEVHQSDEGFRHFQALMRSRNERK